MIPNGSRVVPLLMRYASLAYRTLSLSEILVIKYIYIYIYIFPIVKSALLILFNIIYIYIERERERERERETSGYEAGMPKWTRQLRCHT